MDETLRATRRAMHGIAELLMAGPQYRTSGTIRLQVGDDWFGTVAGPEVRFQRGRVLHDGVPYSLDGTYTDVAERIGVDVGAPAGLYKDGSGVAADEHVVLDVETADRLVRALATGKSALASFAPDTASVLWPEHFDLGITLDEVNYGVSLGDSFLEEPYAYVGPWKPREGEFWNAPFGAVRPLRELGDAALVAEFLSTGRQLTASG